MNLHYEDETVKLWHGDCIEVMRTLPDSSVDSVVCDPPYGLEFMGKDWDSFKTGRGEKYAAGGSLDVDVIASRSGKGGAGPSYVNRPAKRCALCGKQAWSGSPCTCPDPQWVMDNSPLHSFQQWCELWTAECLRVLKPGGHLLAFGGTRTWHRLACAVEDAGFEVRDSIAWLYGSGFPKSLDVSKAIDKSAGAQREVVGTKLGLPGYSLTDGNGDHRTYGRGLGNTGSGEAECSVTTPATPAAADWQGWGTALKPAWESVVVGRKPPALCDRIGSRLDALEDACRRLANGAARSSAPTRHDSPEATTATAPASAATPHEGELARTTRTGAAADSSETTATSWSEWQATTCSNIVTSWKRSLAVVSQPTSTSTTATTSGTTTDLTTLWSSLSQITEPSMLLSETSPDGLSSRARIVDDLFGAALLNWRATRTLTATGPATSGTPHDSQVEGANRLEPIVVARKPLAGTVAANVLEHGTGALNIDGCRIATTDALGGGAATRGSTSHADGWDRPWKSDPVAVAAHTERVAANVVKAETLGRWPANVVLDDTQAAVVDEMSGDSTSRVGKPRGAEAGDGWGMTATGAEYDDSGGASRFFPTFRYEAKAPASERPKVNGTAHPTVKPLALMRWLVRLVTPPGGTVLEPFAGSGTTVEACLLERFRCIAIEREDDYLPLIKARIYRQRNPVEAIKLAGDDLGLFSEETA